MPIIPHSSWTLKLFVTASSFLSCYKNFEFKSSHDSSCISSTLYDISNRPSTVFLTSSFSCACLKHGHLHHHSFIGNAYQFTHALYRQAFVDRSITISCPRKTLRVIQLIRNRNKIHIQKSVHTTREQFVYQNPTKFNCTLLFSFIQRQINCEGVS